jgi:hypothetical protein
MAGRIFPMKLKSHLFLHLGFLLLPIIGSAQSATFPEVGKRYYLNYANRDENPVWPKHEVQLEGLSRGKVTVLKNGGNGWAEVEFVGAVYDPKTQTYAAKPIRVWINFAKVTSAREVTEE